MYLGGGGRRGLGKGPSPEVLAEIVLFGMAGYRGMGQGQCPGDPGCNNPMLQAPLSPDQIAALSASNAAYFNQPSASAQQSLTQWLNANATKVMIGAGVLLLVAALR